MAYFKIRGTCGETVAEMSRSIYEEPWTRERAQEEADAMNAEGGVYKNWHVVRELSSAETIRRLRARLNGRAATMRRLMEANEFLRRQLTEASPMF